MAPTEGLFPEGLQRHGAHGPGPPNAGSFLSTVCPLTTRRDQNGLPSYARRGPGHCPTRHLWLPAPRTPGPSVLRMGGHGPGTRRSSACRRGGGAGPELGQRAHGPSTRHAASRARVCGPVWPGSSRDLNASEAGGRSRLCHGLPASLTRWSSRALAPDELGSYPQLTSLGPHKPTHRSNLVPCTSAQPPTLTTRGPTRGQLGRRVTNAARHPRLARGQPRAALQHRLDGSFPCSR